jgi:glycosyltransferase involved in cell wall biosynthesis
MGPSRPPLIEHGGLVAEALAGPKHFTTRYVGVCASIRAAAAARMPERPHHAVEIPSMVDVSEFESSMRGAVRAAWGIDDPRTAVVGWIGRLDRKKRVEDFLAAAALVRARAPHARFVVIGGPDAFMPEYADELRELARRLRLGPAIRFLGDCPDVARLLAAVDIVVWLSRGEGMPHVIAEAGAAGIPVVATRDNGSEEQIADEVSGLFVPYANPPAAADAIVALLADPALRRRLGSNLRRKVEQEYSAARVVPRWTALFDEVIDEAQRLRAHERPVRCRRA